MSRKRIINCAITGGAHTPTMSPYLPYKPLDIAQHAIDAANAGATTVHIHARNEDDGDSSFDLRVYETIINKIRSVNKDLIINITTGGGLLMTIEERTSMIPHLKPELGSMNCGTANFGMFEMAERFTEWKFEWEKPHFERTKGGIFKNTFLDMELVLKIFDENGVLPELECYDVGHIYTVKYLMQRGLLKRKPYLQFVLGINGVLGAAPQDLVMMKQTADRLIGEGNYEWSAFGIGKNEFPICTQSLFMGGHVRVGMEDSLYLAKGVLAKSNAELVEKMVRIMHEFDYEVMSPAEARQVLDIRK